MGLGIRIAPDRRIGTDLYVYPVLILKIDTYFLPPGFTSIDNRCTSCLDDLGQCYYLCIIAMRSLSISSRSSCLLYVLSWLWLHLHMNLHVHIFIVYWTLTYSTNIWAYAKSNTLDIFPYQSCLSRVKSISVVFITCEIHISAVLVMFTSIPGPRSSRHLCYHHSNRFMPRSSLEVPLPFYTVSEKETLHYSKRSWWLVTKDGFVAR